MSSGGRCFSGNFMVHMLGHMVLWFTAHLYTYFPSSMFRRMHPFSSYSDDTKRGALIQNRGSRHRSSDTASV